MKKTLKALLVLIALGGTFIAGLAIMYDKDLGVRVAKTIREFYTKLHIKIKRFSDEIIGAKATLVSGVEFGDHSEFDVNTSECKYSNAKGKIENLSSSIEIDEELREMYKERYGEMSERYPYLAAYIDSMYGGMKEFEKEFKSNNSRIIYTYDTIKPFIDDIYGDSISMKERQLRENVIAWYISTNVLIDERLVDEILIIEVSKGKHVAYISTISTCFRNLSKKYIMNVDELIRIYPKEICDYTPDEISVLKAYSRYTSTM